MRRLTYSNVVSTLCLFLLLAGGTAFAAGRLGKESVGAAQLKDGAVTWKKIKRGAVQTAELGRHSVTGAKIATWTLGPVPDAAHADASDTATSAGHAASADTATRAAVATTAEALPAPEAPREVGAPGQPQFENGAAYYYDPDTFYRDRQCRVYLEGPVWGQSGSVVFTLPPGDRPAEARLFSVADENTVHQGLIEVEKTGAVRVYSSGSGFQEFSLDGVDFRAAGC